MILSISDREGNYLSVLTSLWVAQQNSKFQHSFTTESHQKLHYPNFRQFPCRNQCIFIYHLCKKKSNIKINVHKIKGGKIIFWVSFLLVIYGAKQKKSKMTDTELCFLLFHLQAIIKQNPQSWYRKSKAREGNKATQIGVSTAFSDPLLPKHLVRQSKGAASRD
jgi:hypothetical protein